MRSNAFTNPNYIKGYLKTCNKVDKTGFIYVESEQDKRFWQEIIGLDTSSLYEFKFTGKRESNKKESVRGKNQYIELVKNAKAEAVCALDSDFSFLTPDLSDFNRNLTSNDFVFHTFGYSKESLENSSEVLDDCLARYYFNERADFSFDVFFRVYSEIVYRFMCMVFYMHNCPERFLKTDFNYNSYIIPDRMDYVINGEWSEFSEKVQLGEQYVDSIIGSDLDGFDEFCILLANKGVTKENVYQFINGHVLHDNIVIPAFNQLKMVLCNKENEQIKEKFKGEEIGHRINEVKNHFANNLSVKTLIFNSINKGGNNLYQRCKAQVAVLT